jgi:hypothetical protein
MLTLCGVRVVGGGGGEVGNVNVTRRLFAPCNAEDGLTLEI